MAEFFRQGRKLEIKVHDMPQFDYSTLDDTQLVELLFTIEDRLEISAAKEIASRDSLIPYLAEVVMDKQSWLAELPEWWAVVHCTYLLAMRGGEDAVVPMLTALRWSDAFDCDWVTELMPSMLGSLGPAMIPGLTAVVRDITAGWSARDLAMKALAAVSLVKPDSKDHVFRIIGERFMDEGEERLLRQLAGQILLDFRNDHYRLALLKFAREEVSRREVEIWYPSAFTPEEVEWIFHNPTPDLWHYQEDWLRFYEPAEIQKRQKRWMRERLGGGKMPKEQGGSSKGGRLLNLRPDNEKPESPGHDPEKPGE